MNDYDILNDLLKPGVPIREIDKSIYSVFKAGNESADYDSKAAAYDRMVSSNLYLRAAWGVTRNQFMDFIDQAFVSRNGPILDLAAGTSLDAVHSYEKSRRPTLVLDLSLAMLQKGAERLRTSLGHIPGNIAFLQADALDLPIADGKISTLLSHGSFHLLPSIETAVAEWKRVLSNEGNIFVTSLVRERWLGNQYLKLLHRAGEVSAPRTAEEVQSILSNGLGVPIEKEISGNFVFVRGSVQNQQAANR